MARREPESIRFAREVARHSDCELAGEFLSAAYFHDGIEAARRDGDGRTPTRDLSGAIDAARHDYNQRCLRRKS